MRVENVTQTKAKKTNCFPFKYQAYSFILYSSIFGQLLVSYSIRNAEVVDGGFKNSTLRTDLFKIVNIANITINDKNF